MLIQPNQPQSQTAHVIVVGNEKGGTGKSTTAMHVAIALCSIGQRVGTIDLDSRQRSLTRAIDNRRAWAQRSGRALPVPQHRAIRPATTPSTADNEQAETSEFLAAVAMFERTCDFIVIDTPGSDGYLMRLAHAMADTLVTPVNDSFLDFDVLGRIDAATYDVVGRSHYAVTVDDARKSRRHLDGVATDWIVVRNRLSSANACDSALISASLDQLALQLGFRVVDGLAERAVYREFFPRGLTALDDLDVATLGRRPNLAHLSAREEVNGLLRQLRLPLDDRGRRRAANRADWAMRLDQPLELHDILRA